MTVYNNKLEVFLRNKERLLELFSKAWSILMSALRKEKFAFMAALSVGLGTIVISSRLEIT